MPAPSDRRYSKTHEWHKPEGDSVTIGITQHAVDELTDITFLDIRKKAGPIKAGEPFGEVESVKATSELYSGIDGTVTAVNQDVLDHPELINQDPYGKGWMIKIKPGSPNATEKLLSAADYEKTQGGH